MSEHPYVPKFEAVVFDMDGVLIDSETFYSQQEARIFRELGLIISLEEHITYQGTATFEMWKKIKANHVLPQSAETLTLLCEEDTLNEYRKIERMETMPGVVKLIDLLHQQGYPLALATSSTPRVIDLVLHKTGLASYFKEVVNSTMTNDNSKPAPDLFLLAASKLGIDPTHCLAIEDSTNGIRAAKRAGMFCIAYNGPGAEHQDQSEADWIIDDYQQMTDFLLESKRTG